MPAEPELTSAERELITFHHRANVEIFAKLTTAEFNFAAPGECGIEE